MSESQEPRTPPPPLPWVAIAVTVIICGIAVHQQITQSHVDTPVLGILALLVLHWSGRLSDALLRKLFGP